MPVGSSRSRLVVVANRLPFRMRRTAAGLRAEPSPGGLATALGPFARSSGVTWVGTAGDTAAVGDDGSLVPRGIMVA